MATTPATPPAVNAASRSDASASDRFAAAQAARKAALEKRKGDRGEAPRERLPDLGGLRLKLSVNGNIPGYKLYWENDEDGKIEQLLFDGFDFVTPDEVGRSSDIVSDMDLSNRISRYVGRREDGSPLRGYLMKCPLDIWEARKAQEQAQANAWDDEIRNGRMKPTGRDQYIPQGYSSKLETNAVQ